jgi:hypothetical protein
MPVESEKKNYLKEIVSPLNRKKEQVQTGTVSKKGEI